MNEICLRTLSFTNPSTRTREICGWKPTSSQMC